MYSFVAIIRYEAIQAVHFSMHGLSFVYKGYEEK